MGVVTVVFEGLVDFAAMTWASAELPARSFTG